MGISLQFWSGKPTWVNLRAHPDGLGAWLSSRSERQERTPWVTTIRKHLLNTTLVAVKQVQGDRIVDLELAGPEGTFILTAELLGKHGNLVLRSPDDRCLAAARWVGPSRSDRPLLPGKPYERPPAPTGRAPFLEALENLLGASVLERRLANITSRAYSVPGLGVTPLRLSAEEWAALGQPAPSEIDSISAALMAASSDAEIVEWSAEKVRLRAQLERVLDARTVATRDLQAVLHDADRAKQLQEWGNLLLAYQGMIPPGATQADVWDAQGEPITIRLVSDLTTLQNAERLFHKAKRAKETRETVQARYDQLRSEATTVGSLLALLERATSEAEVAEVRVEADQRGFLHRQTKSHETPQDRPFDGHAIRERTGPGGWTVLYGENSAANDYLTLRVARPSDWWLHVRGGTSSHVVIRTNNQPHRTPHETLLFAAKIAAQQSTSKHSSYVAVDYTQRRYVRRPKGAPVGTVLYTHEKTLHVDPTARES